MPFYILDSSTHVYAMFFQCLSSDNHSDHTLCRRQHYQPRATTNTFEYRLIPSHPLAFDIQTTPASVSRSLAATHPGLALIL